MRLCSNISRLHETFIFGVIFYCQILKFSATANSDVLDVVCKESLYIKMITFLSMRYQPSWVI